MTLTTFAILVGIAFNVIWTCDVIMFAKQLSLLFKSKINISSDSLYQQSYAILQK